MEKRHVLLCAAGKSPAVITETLFGLYKMGISKGDIYIITTSDAFKVIVEELQGEQGQLDAFNKEYDTRWRLKPIEVVRDKSGAELADLRTTEENMMIANHIFDKVRELTRHDNIILHASLAGGRKTIGFFLGQSMSWFARPEDDLSHVLVPLEYERKGFYFPLRSDTELQNKIDFAPQPFVRLGGFLPTIIKNLDSLTYEQAVTLFQIFLQDQAGQGAIKIDLAEQTIYLQEEEILTLFPQSLALYLFLCLHANLGADQEPFDPLRDAYRYRHELADCLRNLVSRRPKSGALSVLAQPEQEWPEHWLSEGSDELAKQRKKDLDSPFSKLKAAFETHGLERASFNVQHLDRRSPCRSTYWVNIDPQRIVID